MHWDSWAREPSRTNIATLRLRALSIRAFSGVDRSSTCFMQITFWMKEMT